MTKPDNLCARIVAEAARLARREYLPAEEDHPGWQREHERCGDAMGSVAGRLRDIADEVGRLEAERIARSRGAGARIDGEGSKECPHPAESAEAVAWLDGWHAQDAEDRLAALEAERDGLRLTLLAERGDPAGAPSEGWEWHRLASEWRKPRVGFVGRHQPGVWWWVVNGVEGTAPTAREAMQDADAAAKGEEK